MYDVFSGKAKGKGRDGKERDCLFLNLVDSFCLSNNRGSCVIITLKTKKVTY